MSEKGQYVTYILDIMCWGLLAGLLVMQYCIDIASTANTFSNTYSKLVLLLVLPIDFST